MFNISQFRAGFAQVRAGLQVIEDQLVIALAAAGSYWNPADAGVFVTLSNGDRDITGNGGTASAVRSVTSHATGKYYAEVQFDGTGDLFGIANAAFPISSAGYLGEDADGLGYNGFDGTINENGAAPSYGSATSAGDKVSIAVDINGSLVYFAVNGVWQNSADPAAGTGGYSFGVTGPLYLAATPGDMSLLATSSADFTYTPPSGFSAWG